MDVVILVNYIFDLINNIHSNFVYLWEKIFTQCLHRTYDNLNNFYWTIPNSAYSNYSGKIINCFVIILTFIVSLKKMDLVCLVTSWVSSNNHSGFSPISRHCGAIINLNITYKKLLWSFEENQDVTKPTKSKKNSYSSITYNHRKNFIYLKRFFYWKFKYFRSILQNKTKFLKILGNYWSKNKSQNFYNLERWYFHGWWWQHNIYNWKEIPGTGELNQIYSITFII